MAISVEILSNDRLRREYEPPEVGVLDDAECARSKARDHSTTVFKCTHYCVDTSYNVGFNIFERINTETTI